MEKDVRPSISVVFLDIDGVIINGWNSNKADPECVKALNKICDDTGAKIVISSSWRFDGFEDVRSTLIGWGVTGDIIDTTGEELGPGFRGLEILQYLTECEDPICSIVVLDDEPLCMKVLEDYYSIKTDFDSGLTMDQAQDAIDILKKFRYNT